jgi:hypothetical protein
MNPIRPIAAILSVLITLTLFDAVASLARPAGQAAQPELALAQAQTQPGSGHPSASH